MAFFFFFQALHILHALYGFLSRLLSVPSPARYSSDRPKASAMRLANSIDGTAYPPPFILTGNFRLTPLYVAGIDDSSHFYLSNREGLYPGYSILQTKKLIPTESITDAASLLRQKEIKEQYSVLSYYGTNGLADEHIATITSLPQLEKKLFLCSMPRNPEKPLHTNIHMHYMPCCHRCVLYIKSRQPEKM